MVLDNLKKFKIVLASNSPRRRELMTGLGVDYVVKTLPDIDESYPDTLTGEAIPAYISRKKAKAYQDKIEPGELFITADTIVWLDGAMMGKPKDRDDALHILRELSGKSHQVITGVCLTTREWQKSFTSVTDVKFAMLTDEEIEFYVDNYKPYDKAGSYGVQEWIGFVAVEAIYGSCFNIMGLPIQKLYQELKKL